MDLQNMENYPVYILNVIPELSEEDNPQIPQQVTSGGQLSYNYYVPNVEDHAPMVNTEIIPPVSPRKMNTKSARQLSYEKIVHNAAGNHKQNAEAHSSTFLEKSVSDLSSLLKDEDINDANDKVLKYDQKTDTNVIFHLVRPTDLEERPIEIKVPKRGRPRKIVSEQIKSEKNQNQKSKPEDIVEYPLISTKSGRLSKPPKHLLNGEKIIETKKDSLPIIDYDAVHRRKKVKYNVKSDFVCRGCGKTYLGHKRMQEHLERFPTHKMNAAEQADCKQVDTELQDIFKNLHETPTNIDVESINGKKETHTQTENSKDRYCGFIKSKKNLSIHLKQILKHLKKSNLIKSLSGTVSVWDLLSSNLESGNLQEFSKELQILVVNLKSLSESLKLVSKCESSLINNNQMFIDDSLGHLFGLTQGTYALHHIENEYEIEQASNVWTMTSPIKSVEPKTSTPKSLNHHSSPIHLNLFDSQSSKVDFLLSSSMEESIMCEDNQAVLESVDGLVSERLRSMTDHLHSDVPIIDYPIVSTSSTSNISQPDSFMGHGVYEVFSNELNLVPTSTEEFIKSLEQFEPLNGNDNTLSTEPRMLDFEDLQHTFHST